MSCSKVEIDPYDRGMIQEEDKALSISESEGEGEEENE